LDALIEIPFGGHTVVDPRHHVLGGGIHWYNFANMIEWSCLS